MLVINVELWPFGNEEQKRTIAKMRIWNDGHGTETYGDYQAEIMPIQGDLFPVKVEKLSLKHHMRQQTVWRLVQKCLNEWFGRAA